ncbi:serine hydrolase domain-containing protein [Streptomyces ochraceiscleroticus]|uniref:Serine hydrolase domain-containing protein n=1 Tax=Streptomyces ochraceiscleroticus TaxID=47761 RepID=A0ABW1MDG9_9ACTN|nr:serine hydrolase domain-containing protein [Streptomyces ochraceiscleroticus]
MRARIALAGALAAALAGTALLTAPAATAAGPGPDGHAGTKAAMEAQVAKGVPGMIGQVTEGRRVWRATAGVGNLDTGEPRGAGDAFRVGSITKTFVATVLLQLEAEGRLDLDDTVEEWLPGVVQGHGHDGSRITLRQLLNHTSGIREIFEEKEFRDKVTGPGFLKHRDDTWTPRQLVRLAMNGKPTFEPGTSWSYSNTNYLLAGMVIEKATGKPYATEVRRRVLNPLGLRHTVVPGTDHRIPGPHGIAYSKLLVEKPGTEVYDATELNPSLAGPAGEMISTAGDLNRFYAAVLRGKLFPQRQLKEMLTTVPVGAEAPGIRYGLGLMTQKLSCGVRLYGHGGGIHGSSSEAVSTRDGRHTAAFNSNADWTGDSEPVVEAEFCG